MHITEIKQKAGAKKFVSIFGKSTVARESTDYTLVQEVVRLLIENDYGVMHGGYAGGIMEAVAEEAFRTIQTHNFPLERNIGVPQKQHDEAGWARVPHAVFTDVSNSVFERLQNITNTDIAIVAPLGGDGTLLELATIWHENVTSNRSKPIIPIIVLQTEAGTNWKLILETMNRELDNGSNTLTDIPWLHFAPDSKTCMKVLTGALSV